MYFKMDALVHFSVLFCILTRILGEEIVTVEQEETTKECYGTYNGFGINGNHEFHYEYLRRRYKDCTHVDGNLEVTHVDKAINASFDISFLSSIRVVTGYVILALLRVETIPLINLRLIRADKTYNIGGEKYGLIVALTSEAGDDPLRLGLRELQLPALQEISKGKVLFARNPHLCYVQTINWRALVPDDEQPVIYSYKAYSEQCEKECDPECEIDGRRSCWGESRFMCQTIRSVQCHSSCPWRCYDSSILGCCHPECAIGCHGPTDEDCVMCKYFKQGRRCVPYRCPNNFRKVGQECILN